MTRTRPRPPVRPARRPGRAGSQRLPQQAVASHRRRSPLRLRDWRVRSKLAAVLTIPAFGFLVVAGVQIVSSVDQAQSLGDFSRQVAFGRQVTGLVHELQRERDHTAGLLATLGRPEANPAERNVANLAPDRTAVDRAIVAWRAAAEPLRHNATLDAAYDTVEARLAELAPVRRGVQAGWLRAQAAFDAYSQTIGDLQALLPLPATVGGDARLGQSVRAFANLSRAKELAAQIRGRLFAVCTATRFEPGEFEILADMRAQRLAAFDRFRGDAGPSEVARFDEAVSGQAVRNASRLEQSVVDNAAAADVSVDAQQWWQASTTELELMRSVEVQLLDAAANGAAARSAQQWRSTVLGSSLSLLLLGFATMTSLVIGRSMADSLRGLREQALDVAQRRLPQVLEQLRAAPRGLQAIEVERLAVRTADEVGEVAEAFTAVHRSAVRLASEQALMRQNVNDIFVNLARRSQTLVERQLQLLDGLEASEMDPTQLENLFRLDHLATRMRRNDENLLVLAGGDSTRRWTDPVALGAVALAATAEIEQYARVRHDITDDLYVAGHAVADLVHLVAELLENATVFSPPDTQVSVLGWAGADGSAVLVIQDEGIGMSADLVAHANTQLATPVSLNVAAAERMGLVVVGHLAGRHGIRVEIRSQGTTAMTPGGVGVAAIVVLPARILAAATLRAMTWAGPPARWLPQDRDAAPAELEGSVAGQSARRAVPTRAEDVLGQARSRDDGSVWWSKPGAARRLPKPAAIPAAPTAPAASEPAPAVNGAISHAGLPIRVPMAHLPEGRAAVPSRRVMTEPDPVEVGSVLTQFYGGVHRAASEDDEETSG